MEITKMNSKSFFFIWITLCFIFLSARSRAEDSIQISSSRQLFIDDYLIDKLHRVERTFHSVTKHPQNPIITADQPWEGLDAYLRSEREKSPDSDLRSRVNEKHTQIKGYGGWVLVYGTVLFDKQDQLFKIWYQTVAGFESGPENVVCYATSSDGVHWQKPNLGLIDYNGLRANNIVIRSSTFENFDECFSVVIDTQETDFKKRYKAIFWSPKHDDYPHAVWSATSADGIQWKKSDKPILRSVADATSFFFDHLQDRYVAVPRPLDDQISKAVSFSTDFKTWTVPQTVLRPLPEKEKAGEAREQIYNMYPFTYESMYLGIAQVYYWHPRWALEGEWMYSRDCLKWIRPEPWQPHLPVGGPGEFDRANNSFSSGPPLRVGDQLYFYYSGRSYRHREYHHYPFGKEEQDSGPWEAAIGMATLRVDGFASLDAPFGPDRYVLTQPLVFQGKHLHINAKCNWGNIQVELLTDQGKPIPGFTANDCDLIRQDATDIRVSWQENPDLSMRRNQPTRLRFVMQNSQLFSFWIE